MDAIAEEIGAKPDLFRLDRLSLLPALLFGPAGIIFLREMPGPRCLITCFIREPVARSLLARLLHCGVVAAQD
jgi:hypothetical protein